MSERSAAARYVVYLRKSTDDLAKQVRSIGDQRAACMRLAKQQGITIAPKDIIAEDRSARRSGNRPKFSKLLDDIRTRKVDGLIAWAPDRLARNMKEAGEIIDLIDAGYITDLKFAAYYFHNDYNGVMALGIAFVLAKQYTDKLAHDVRRGVTRALEEGRSGGQYKPGYKRDEKTGFYMPDETLSASGKTMFELIQDAWTRRVAGDSLRAVAEQLRDHGFYRQFKRSDKRQLMTHEKLRKMFNDPFYYGVLVQAGKSIDMRELDTATYEPMVREDEFRSVQRLTRPELAVPKRHKYPFRGLLTCGECGRALLAGAPRGRRGHRSLRYWCGSKDCPSAGIRAKEVISAMSEVLSRLRGTQAHHRRYAAEARRALHARRKALVSERGVRKKRLRQSEDALEVLLLTTAEDAHEERVLQRRKNKIKDQLRAMERRLREIERELSVLEPLTLEKFLNTLNTLPRSLKYGDAVQKDIIARNTFLNLTVEHGKVASIKVHEPFATMLKEGKVALGRGDGSRFEPVAPRLDTLSSNSHQTLFEALEMPNETPRNATHYDDSVVY